jgi:glycosyltransferase involved in cell wall biosynthesis
MAVPQPLVTVIVASYNYAQFIEGCLDSVAGQSYRPLELLIIDDCSTDGSVDVIRGWIKRHDIDARLIVQERNRGVCAGLNRALSLASGKYIAMLSSDDSWSEDKLARQVACFEALPEDVGLVYGGVRRIDAQGLDLSGQPFPPRTLTGDIFHRLIRREGTIIPSATLIRKASLDAVGPYDESLLVEDYDMWLRLARKYKVAVCPAVSTNYRVHEASYFRRHRHETRWVETEILVDLKHLHVDRECDRVLKRRILLNLRRLYPDRGARYGMLVQRVFARWKHPLVPGFYAARRLRLPFIVVRGTCRAWLTLAERLPSMM